MFNDGTLRIYQKVVTDNNRGALDATELKLVGSAFYGEIGFSATEYYAAKQAETAVEKRVRILENKSICNKHIIAIADTKYEVGRANSRVVKGIAVTDITLERVTAKYDIA